MAGLLFGPSYKTALCNREGHKSLSYITGFIQRVFSSRRPQKNRIAGGPPKKSPHLSTGHFFKGSARLFHPLRGLGSFRRLRRGDGLRGVGLSPAPSPATRSSAVFVVGLQPRKKHSASSAAAAFSPLRSSPRPPRQGRPVRPRWGLPT